MKKMLFTLVVFALSNSVFFGGAVLATASPQANDDVSTIVQGTGTVLINWMSNDSIVDFATLNGFDAISLNGASVVVGPTGFFSYTPPPAFSGVDGFTYTICDDDKPEPTCSTASVSITVVAKSTCEAGFYQAISGQVKLLDITSAPASYVDIGSPAVGGNYNATGYNSIDGLIYGFTSSLDEIQSFDPTTGVFTTVFTHTEDNPFSGDFDDTGKLYYQSGNSLTMWIYDTVTNSRSSITLSQRMRVADMAYYPADGHFYGPMSGGTTLSKMDPATGIVTYIPISGAMTASGGGLGASWVSGGVNLYSFDNASGNIYKTNTTTGASVLTAASQPNGRNDGMSCAAAVDPFDLDSMSEYGDAPDSYGTTQASTGAAAVNNLAFRLGGFVDIDADGQPGIGADLDELDGGPDEDGAFWNGVSLQNQGLPVDSPANIQVSVPSDNGVVSAWFDWNANGVFDPSEKVLSDVAPTGGQITISTSVPSTAVLGTTYARFRLSARPGGGPTDRFSFGEIEDYRIQVVNPNPELTVSKSADTSAFSDPVVAGDVITYTVTTQNTGNVPVTDMTIDDPLFDPSDITSSCVFPVSATDGLKPQEVASCTATYELTQDDIDAGSVENTATASGKDPKGGDVEDDSDSSNPNDDTGEDDDKTVVSLTPKPELTVDKSSSAVFSTPPAVGDIITYTIAVENIGNVTISSIVIDDPLFDPSNITADCTFPAAGVATLAPTESATCEVEYAIDQDDINAGNVENTATASGKDPKGGDVEDDSDSSNEGDGTEEGKDDPTNTGIAQVAEITVVKSVDISEVSDPVMPGDIITYTIVTTNTGNVTVNDMTITDALLGGDITADCTFPVSPTAGLDPAQAAACEVAYTLTVADINSGSVENTATASGKDPKGGDVEDDSDGNTENEEGDEPTIFEFDKEPMLDLTKLVAFVDVDEDGIVDPGDELFYTFVIENTGNVTVTGILITDPLLTVNGGPIDLDPTNVDSTTFSGTYVLTDDDILAGGVENQATADGKDPDGGDVEATSDNVEETSEGDEDTDDPTFFELDKEPKLVLVKTADGSGVGDPAQLGDIITYTITVENTGNVTVTNIEVTDELLGGDITSSCTFPIDAATGLAPTETATCTVTYTLTQADLDTGYVENTAVAEGEDPSGGDVMDDSDAGDELTETPAGDGSTDGDPTNDPTVVTLNVEELPEEELPEAEELSETGELPEVEELPETGLGILSTIFVGLTILGLLGIVTLQSRSHVVSHKDSFRQ